MSASGVVEASGSCILPMVAEDIAVDVGALIASVWAWNDVALRVSTQSRSPTGERC